MTLALIRLLENEATADDVAEIAARLRRWVLQDARGCRQISMHRWFGVCGLSNTRTLWCDEVLVKAARLTGRVSAWDQMIALHSEIKEFARMWPAWRELSEPPSHASAIQQLLWRAQRIKRVPRTRRGLWKRLGKLLDSAD